MLLLAMITIMGCSDSESENQESPETENEESTEKESEEAAEPEKEQKVVDKSESAQHNEDIEKEMLNEEGIVDVSLLITEDGGGYVIADVEVDSAMDNATAKGIAETYANKLKEAYPEYSVDIQTHKSGEPFEKVTVE